MTQPQLYSKKIGGQTFFLPAHIKPASIVGKGSYGVVVSATDSQLGKKVAIKRIKPYCGDEWEARHTLREVRLMRLLGVHPNIISLTNLWTNDDKDSELYIVMELMDSDLHQIIQSKQQLSEPHHQCLMKQLLLGVQAMHTLGVLHRDLKPGNLLVTRDCQLRITDFGLARAWDKVDNSGSGGGDNPASSSAAEGGGLGGAGMGVGGGDVGAMTEYVVTRWYRCPELLLAPHLPYDGAIDLWSVGCIFAEVANRRPLFPGKSYVHQVQVILDVLGTPNSDTGEIGFKPRDDAATFLRRQRHRNPVPWAQLLPTSSSEASRSFLASLLTWDPKKRLTVDQALGHRWLAHCPALPGPPSQGGLGAVLAHKEKAGIDFRFEDPSTPLPVLKQMVVDEVAAFQRDQREALLAAGGGQNKNGAASSSSSSSRAVHQPAVATKARATAYAEGGGGQGLPPAPADNATPSANSPPAPTRGASAGSAQQQQQAPRQPQPQIGQQQKNGLPSKKSSSSLPGGPLQGVGAMTVKGVVASGYVSPELLAQQEEQRRLNEHELATAYKQPPAQSSSSSSSFMSSGGSGDPHKVGGSGALVRQGSLRRQGSGRGGSRGVGEQSNVGGHGLQPSHSPVRRGSNGSGGGVVGRFGKIEGKPGVGGIPPRKTLPTIPPIVHRQSGTSGGSLAGVGQAGGGGVAGLGSGRIGSGRLGSGRRMSGGGGNGVSGASGGALVPLRRNSGGVGVGGLLERVRSGGR